MRQNIVDELDDVLTSQLKETQAMRAWLNENYPIEGTLAHAYEQFGEWLKANNPLESDPYYPVE